MTKNDLIERVADNFYTDYSEKRLYYCRADIHVVNPIRDYGYSAYILRSYSTIVAVALFNPSIEGFEMYVFDYYSSTTNTTHIPRFIRWLNENIAAVKCRYDLYFHSYDRKAFREQMKSTDFSPLIDEKLVDYYLL